MKIAILAHLHHPIAEPYAGGTEMHTAAVADELSRRGHEVVLFAKEGSRTQAQLSPLVEETFEFGRKPGPDGRTSEHILTSAVTEGIRLIWTGDFDAVLNNSLGPLPYTLLTGHPMLTVLHTPPTLEKVLAVITDPGWRADPAHRWASVSDTNTMAWAPLLPQVLSIPNGIHLDRWRDQQIAEPDLAVWSARITPEKGLHLAIDAVREALMRLRICGPIADPAYFATEIRPRLGSDVVYVGHLRHETLPGELARAAVFVSSSVWPEPFGLSLVEAMACGTPVAAFATGAAAEIVTESAGALACEQSVPALARAIRRARRCAREQARSRAADFDLQHMVDRYEELLKQIAGEGRASIDHEDRRLSLRTSGSVRKGVGPAPGQPPSAARLPQRLKSDG